MRIKSILSAGLVAAAFAAGTASAAQSGFYVGADVGRSSVGTVAPGLAMTKSTDTVGGVFVGYQFTENWGVEGFYTGGGKFSATNAAMTGYGSGKSDVYGLDLVGTAPLADNFSVYGKLGYASTKTSASDTSGTTSGATRSAATYGLGLEYDVMPQVGIRFGWDRYGAAINNAGVKSNFNSNVWAIGVLYKF